MSSTSDQSQQSQQDPDRSESIVDGEGTGEGIELTVGEPNSFEPEDDPDGAETDTASDTAAHTGADPRKDPDPGTLI